MTERRLVVNLDHVATVRQTRSGVEPDPVTAATLAVLAGADGIAVHLREDRRHVQDRDLRVLRQTIHGRLCLEMAATQEMLKLALDVRPDSVTLVPERPEELASAGGLDVQSRIGEIGEIARALHESGIRAGLCIDPDLEQVKAAHRVGARAVELHAGRYGERGPDHDEVLRRIEDAVRLAAKLKLEIGVGHGIDYGNVGKLAENDLIDEFSIGHAIVSRAIYVGMERAVREMKQIVGHA
ncbi:MAG: pyridoxine 5'-phosphate synthase [Deltaproteobacteria bacterium]|nr:pyridoxine 5'-phosphate synthase [Deltaproteobacteria bacterium]